MEACPDHNPTRRKLLLGLGAALLGLGLPSPPQAHAKATKVRSRLVDVERGRFGTTLYLELAQAPFPYSGKRWTDATTVVYVPHHHRVSANRRNKVHLVLHFHGHGTTARQAIKDHQLREQLAESRQNAILVVPQLPVRAKTGHPGKLNDPGGLLRFLTDLRETLQSRKVRKALGKSALHRRSRIGYVCLSAHSGGYRAAVACLKHGDFKIRELYLFDSLYSGADVVSAWAAKGRRTKKQWTRKIVSYYAGGSVARQNRKLMRLLDQKNIPYFHETKEGTLTRAEFTTGRAIFVKTRNSHRGVTHDLNGLRDCLYASSLPRRGALDTNWFDRKHKPRRLEQRED